MSARVNKTVCSFYALQGSIGTVVRQVLLLDSSHIFSLGYDPATFRRVSLK